LQEKEFGAEVLLPVRKASMEAGLQQLQQPQSFGGRASFEDFVREARFYTPTEISLEKAKQRNKKILYYSPKKVENNENLIWQKNTANSVKTTIINVQESGVVLSFC